MKDESDGPHRSPSPLNFPFYSAQWNAPEAQARAIDNRIIVIKSVH
jgi:hypothetical protein